MTDPNQYEDMRQRTIEEFAAMPSVQQMADELGLPTRLAYLDTISAAKAAGTPTPRELSNAPHQGPDGYAHQLPIPDPDALIDLDLLAQLIDAVQQLAATSLYTAGRDDQTCALGLILEPYFWRKPQVQLQVCIDLPHFKTLDPELKNMAGYGMFPTAVPAKLALAQLSEHMQAPWFVRNPSLPTPQTPLDKAGLELLAESANMLADAYEHYFTYSDGHCKSYEGRVELFLGLNGALTRVHLDSYVYDEETDSQDFNTIDGLHQAAQNTHTAEFSEDYSWN